MRSLLRPGAILALATGAALTTGVMPASAHTDDSKTFKITDNGTSLSLSDHDVHAGQLTLKITSTSPLDAMGNGGADVTVFKPHHGITVEDVYAHIRAQRSPDAAASTVWLTKNVSIYGGAAIGGTGTARDVITLAAGDYTVADVNSVFTPGAAVVSAMLHVRGALSPHLLPAISSTIDTTSSDRFRVTSSTLRARGNYLVRNVSDTIHFVLFSPVKAGTTDDAVTAATSDPNATGEPAFYDHSRTSVQAGVLSPGKQQVFSSRLLKPGTYDLECFIADDKTGMPHFFMGMHKIVVVK